MIDALAVAVTLALVLVGLVSALGCEGGRHFPHVVLLAFRYDPNLVISGSRIVVERVDFRLERLDADWSSLGGNITGREFRVRVLSDGTATLNEDVSETPLGFADPGLGHYWHWGVHLSNDPNLRVRARCEAFQKKDDPLATYPSGAPSKEEVATHHLQFVFRLVQQNAQWVVVPE